MISKLYTVKYYVKLCLFSIRNRLSFHATNTFWFLSSNLLQELAILPAPSYMGDLGTRLVAHGTPISEKLSKMGSTINEDASDVRG